MARLADVYIGTRIPSPLNERIKATALRENNRPSAVVRRWLTDAADREEAAREMATRERSRKRAS
jgi:hypothetical protein